MPIRLPNARQQPWSSATEYGAYRSAAGNAGNGRIDFPIPDDTYRMRRLHVERYTTRARFAGMFAFPKLFC